MAGYLRRLAERATGALSAPALRPALRTRDPGAGDTEDAAFVEPVTGSGPPPAPAPVTPPPIAEAERPPSPPLSPGGDKPKATEAHPPGQPVRSKGKVPGGEVAPDAIRPVQRPSQTAPTLPVPAPGRARPEPPALSRHHGSRADTPEPGARHAPVAATPPVASDAPNPPPARARVLSASAPPMAPPDPGTEEPAREPPPAAPAIRRAGATAPSSEQPRAPTPPLAPPAPRPEAPLPPERAGVEIGAVRIEIVTPPVPDKPRKSRGLRKPRSSGFGRPATAGCGTGLGKG